MTQGVYPCAVIAQSGTRRWQVVASIALALVLFVYFLSRVSMADVLATVARVRVPWLLASVATALTSYVLRALRNGAAAYILKDCGTSALMEGIREAAAGRRYLCPQLCSRAIDVYATQGTDLASDSYESLSPREREVLQLAAEGRTNVQIAARLFIGTRTVETHRAHLIKKLGLRTQVDLVRYAIQHGIIPAAG